ncbi:MAG: NAD-dependent epimerase/dehydratase family protein [Bacilli bacterium]|nr:NAD-dependent epimerase/dehydratase family protein [Bacilli bacterium]
MKYTNIVDEDVVNIIKDAKLNECLDKFQDKTFLITGASGMVGSYLCFVALKMNELYNTNTKVITVVRNPEKLSPVIRENKDVEILVQDVTKPFNIDENIDYIIHAASPASPKIMKEHPVETNLANTLGTINTLALAKEKNTDGYLFISSREIYGEPNVGQELFYENGPLGQVDPLVPRNGYAEGKKAAENLCSGYKEEYGLNTKIVRLAHTYGPGMSIYDGRVQADFLNNVVHNENIVLKSDGSSVRSYTYISDAITAIISVLLKSQDLVYNIADENSKTSIRELAQTLVDIDPSKGLELIFDIPKEQLKGVASFTGGILSTDKIRSELGWTPRYSIKEGFARTIVHIEDELKEEKTRKL